MIVIGELKYFKGEHAKIHVCGFKDSLSHDWQFDKDEILQVFEPNGFIFEPGFKLNYPTHICGDLLEFEAELNPKVDKENPGDLYKIKFKGIKSHNYNYRIIEFEHLFINPYFVDLDYLSSQIDNSYKYSFYVLFENIYYGPFKIKNGIIYYLT